MGRNAILLLALSSVTSLAQTAANGNPQHAVRDTLDRYFAALRTADRDALAPLARPNAARFSSGGTRLGNVHSRNLVNRAKVSFYVRHVEMLSPDIALAIGLWRNTDPGAIYTSGAVDYTLIQEGGKWKLATIRETLGQPIPSLPHGMQAPMMRDGEWEVLFDGKGAAHWLTLKGARDLGGSWRVAEGSLMPLLNSPGADLRSDREYRTFELQWEWMAAKGSNSGIKYRLYGADAFSFTEPRYAAGWEYQMADDAGDPGARANDNQKSGALYGVVPVRQALAKPAGQWNESRLVVASTYAEHWLNGVLAARHLIDIPFDSPIALQHHQSEVRFRNIRIRRLDK